MADMQLKRLAWHPLKKLLGALIIMALLAASGALAWIVAAERTPSSNYRPAQHTVSSDRIPAGETVTAAVHVLHQQLDDLTGYGGIDVFDFDLKKAALRDMQQQLLAFIPETGNRFVKKDLQNAHDLLSVAAKYRDKEALRYAHRVLHDLDIDLHKSEGTHLYFKVTNNAGGVNVEKVARLLDR